MKGLLTTNVNAELLRVVKNTGWLMVDKVVRLIVGVFVFAEVAKYLGPELQGSYNYVLALVALLSSFAKLGLDNVLIKRIVDNDRVNEYLGTAYMLKLIGSIVTVLLVLLVVLIVRADSIDSGLMAVAIGSSLIFQSFDVIDFFFQSIVHVAAVVVAKDIAFLLSNAYKLVLITIGAPLIWFAVAYSLEFALAAIGMVVAYRLNNFRILKWQVDWDIAKGLIKESWPLILSGFVVMIYMRVDQLLIGQMLGDTELGYYSVSVKLSELWYYVPTAVIMSIFPHIIKVRQKNADKYWKRLQQLVDMFTWSLMLISFVVTILSPTIINVLYGAEYAPAATVLAIHIWTGYFVAMGLISARHLIIAGETKLTFYRSAAGAVVNVVLNLWLIPQLGINGAAIATLVSQAVASFFSNLFFASTRKLFFQFLIAFSPLHVYRYYLSLNEYRRVTT